MKKALLILISSLFLTGLVYADGVGKVVKVQGKKVIIELSEGSVTVGEEVEIYPVEAEEEGC